MLKSAFNIPSAGKGVQARADTTQSPLRSMHPGSGILKLPHSPILQHIWTQASKLDLRGFDHPHGSMGSACDIIPQLAGSSGGKRPCDWDLKIRNGSGGERRFLLASARLVSGR